MSRKKRVSWFFESQPEPKEEQNVSSLHNNTVEEQKQDQKIPSAQITQPMQSIPQAPQTIPTTQFDLESNRTRKVSFIPFIGNRVAESTPPKLSTIFEEQPSSKKQEPQQNKVPVAQQTQIQMSIQKQPTIQTQIIQTPQQQPYRTPKAIQIEENSGKQSYRKNVKPIEIDIVKELQQLSSLAEMNEATLKRVITREEQEILIIQDLLTQKISKLQQKLIQLNEIEQKQLDSKMNNNNKLNQLQEIENINENQLDEPKKQEQKGSSQQIRAILIQCLGYKVSHIYYDKKQYQITFTYKQANVQYTFQNQKQIDGNLEIQEIFNEFYRELQENRLVLSGLKVDYKQKTEINKGEILQLSLKHQFQNSNKMANEIIFSAIHQMPILLSKVDELELQLLSNNKIWGTLWKLDPERGSIQILFSHRCRIDDKNLQSNSKKKILRFEINLRTFEIQYQFFKYFDEIISPFIQKDSKRKKSVSEISFGERAEGLVSDEFTEAIQDYLSRKPNLQELVEWLNIIQLN
ncbi:unnamed protein product [Paramecium pentaurelia]|uniref:Uncharacterized protein n=1 Tax=Paramecium pentaurelia TaxID=43138 RepID=A0A8S1TRZ5_9CILI|nr:unnamed protein product [Paramecium pentaurelia]